MLNLSASQATKKAVGELLDGIAAAMDLTPGQAKFMLMLGWALLAFCLFHHLRRYVLAAPEVPAEETFQAAGKRLLDGRQDSPTEDDQDPFATYALLSLIAGVLILIQGLACLFHAEKAERLRREGAARKAPAKPLYFMAKPSPEANDPSNPKKVTVEELKQALENWRKKSSQQTPGKKAGEEPAKAPADPAPEKLPAEQAAPAAK